jgi:hypothetical protein
MQLSPEVEAKFTTDLTTTAQKIQSLQVTNDQELHVANDVLVEIKKKITEREDFFAPIVESAHEAHKIAVGKRKAIVEPLKALLDGLKSKAANYLADQERKRQEAERKAQEAAQRAEDKKREELLAKAQAEAEKGNTEKSEALLERAADVYVAPKPVAAPIKTDNMTSTFTIEVIVEAKANVPDMYKVVDEGMLRRAFQASKYQLSVPGVRFVKKPTVQVRTR